MPKPPVLILVEPTGTRRDIHLLRTPFTLGRQSGNDIILHDLRISRQQAQIVQEGDRYFLEDLRSRHGTFLNGERTTRCELRHNDKIDFGLADSYSVIFCSEEAALDDFIKRVVPAAPAASRELYHLGLLLEVARVLHAGLVLEDVLAAVVDAALEVTHAERGVLLLRQDSGELAPGVARDNQRRTLRSAGLEVSQSVLEQVKNTCREVMLSDEAAAEALERQASIARLQLHTILAMPLLSVPAVATLDTTVLRAPAELLGILYLDSRQVTGLSELDREVVRSLAREAGTVIENARLFAAAREKEKLEGQLAVAREIQRGLLPKQLPAGGYFEVAGINLTSEAVGGDVFDVIPLPEDRYGFVLADVVGKGISGALLAATLQGVAASIAAFDLPPEAIAARINRYLVERTAEDKFATWFFGVLSPDGRFRYVNAAHPAPLWLHSSGEVAPLPTSNLPLGLFTDVEFASDRVQLQPGDSLLLFSDGLTEAADPDGQLFGDEQVHSMLPGLRALPLELMQEAILQRVGEFVRGASQADDLTLLILRYLGKKS
ncbi:MAG TPA: SpoIIE family protein phosphatase [Candidatus Acidoferrales bacterium]